MASDDFNGSPNGTPLTTHNPDWGSIGETGTLDSFPVSNFEIQNDACQSNASFASAGARYTTSTERFTEVTIGPISDIGNLDTNVRLCIAATDTRQGYNARLAFQAGPEISNAVFYTDEGVTDDFRANFAFTAPISSNQQNTFRLEDDGGTIRFYVNGVEEGSWVDTVNITGGNPGFLVRLANPIFPWDDWTDGVAAGPTVGTVNATAGGEPTDTTLPAGATAQINNADGGTYWAGIWPQASRPTTHAQIVAGTGAVGAVQTGTIPGGGLVTLAEYTGLTASTPYALYVTAEDTGATPVPDGQAGFDDFSTLAPQLVVVIPLVDVETGAPWPDASTILYDLWDAADWHNTGTPQAAAEVGSGVTAGGGVLTISTFALAQGTPTFTVMYEEEGTTPGFSPDDFFGVSRQNSVELGLINAQGAAQYIESPQGSVNWVPTEEFLTSKQVMAQTQVAMQTGSTFRLVFDFDVPPDMLALNLWRALGSGPPDNAAQSVVQVDARTLDVTFAKVYDPGRNAVLQFIGVKYGEGNSIPRSTWPRQSP